MNQDNCTEHSRWKRAKHSLAEKIPLAAGVAMIGHAATHMTPFIYKAANGHNHREGGLYAVLDHTAHFMEHPAFLAGIGGVIVADYFLHKKTHKQLHALESENAQLRDQLQAQTAPYEPTGHSQP